MTEFITKHDVKELLKIDERTYQIYLKNGILKPYKISDDSRLYKFKKQDVKNVFAPPKKAKVITVANNKGGTGKSFISYNLGHILSEDKKVLFIENDGQGHLSTLCNIDINNLSKEDFVNCRIIEIKNNLSILPANITLSALEVDLQNKINRERWLEKNIINKVRNKYDYIIIDTAPSLSLLNINAFAVSDIVLIPINPDTLSILGLDTVIGIIDEIKDNINNKIIYKIIMNKYTKNRVMTSEIINLLEKNYKDHLLDIKIIYTQKVIDALALKQTVKDDSINASFNELKKYLLEIL